MAYSECSVCGQAKEAREMSYCALCHRPICSRCAYENRDRCPECAEEENDQD